MPPLSTHIHFAQFILEKISYNQKCFVLGAIAPDSFERDDERSFNLHHFTRGGSDPDLSQFVKVSSKIRLQANHPILSFVDGYYSHLWLDTYFKTHGQTLRNIIDSSLKTGCPTTEASLVMERYDAAAVQTFNKNFPWDSFTVEGIPNFEFLRNQAVKEIFQSFRMSLVKLEEHETNLLFDATVYDQFLIEAANKIIDELQSFY